MSSDSLNRARWSSGIWFAAAYGIGILVGAEVNPADVAVDAGLMGASSLSADYVHSVLGLVPSTVSSAAVTGLAFAGAQKLWRNDDSYITNGVAAAANEVLVDWAGSMYVGSDAADSDSEIFEGM